MQLDERMMRLIAVGASIAANCQSCLQANIDKARGIGCDEQEIAEAVWVGKRIRRGAAAMMDSCAAGLCSMAPLGENPIKESCDCNS